VAGQTGGVVVKLPEGGSQSFIGPAGLYLRVIQFRAVLMPLIAQARLTSGRERSRSDCGRWASIWHKKIATIFMVASKWAALWFFYRPAILLTGDITRVMILGFYGSVVPKSMKQVLSIVFRVLGGWRTGDRVAIHLY